MGSARTAVTATVLLLLLAGTVAAGSVEGTVRDGRTGSALAGVVVDLAGTPHQTSSSREGAFSFAGVPAGRHTLRATLPGYARLEVDVFVEAAPIAMSLALQPARVRIDEAITVTAQRDERRAWDVPEAVSALEADALARQALRSTPEALAGLHGVFVQKTNHGGGSPFVRGLTGNQLLLMVDGIRLNNSTFRYGPNQYLNSIAPHSIERVEVVDRKSVV